MSPHPGPNAPLSKTVSSKAQGEQGHAHVIPAVSSASQVDHTFSQHPGGFYLSLATPGYSRAGQISPYPIYVLVGKKCTHGAHICSQNRHTHKTIKLIFSPIQVAQRQVWWYTPVILTLRKLRQCNSTFKARMSYIVPAT